jgi:hypothetical protein
MYLWWFIVFSVVDFNLFFRSGSVVLFVGVYRFGVRIIKKHLCLTIELLSGHRKAFYILTIYFKVI